MKPASRLATLLILLCSLAAAQESALQPSAQPAPVTLDPWVLHSKLVQEVTPEYPVEARDHKIQGDVTIDVLVAQDGNVASAKWVITSGAISILADAALAAVRRWRYQPTLMNDKPASVSSWILIRFRLEPHPDVEILTKAQASTPQAKPQEVKRPLKLRVSSGVAEQNLIHRVEPQYPPEAIDQHITGDVLLQVLIAKDGSVTNIHPVSGSPVLIVAAVEAIRQWKYRPYTLNGEPVEVETTITIRFHM
jgi:TonB family protein